MVSVQDLMYFLHNAFQILYVLSHIDMMDRICIQTLHIPFTCTGVAISLISGVLFTADGVAGD